MQVVHFDLTSEHIDLHSLLKAAGIVDSGGAGKELVASGVVSVDDLPELRKSAKIRAGQRVKLPGVTIYVQGGAKEQA
ncbi:MAG: RNA-binding S4 domain-containing protein [Rhizobacter sp.]|nr:RNA-binding S4 domain-containing protein [Burkholderiales bacterium]